MNLSVRPALRGPIPRGGQLRLAPRPAKTATTPPAVAAAHARHPARPPRAIAAPQAALEGGPQAEVSRAVYESTVLFLLQQDCDIQLQRALNRDDFELAAAIRKQRTRVDEAVSRLRAFRDAAASGASDEEAAAAAASAGSTGAGPGDSVDAGLAALRLRSELNAAVEAEDYTTASRLRDELKALEAKAAEAQGAAAAAVSPRSGASPPALRLGQRVTHVGAGWRGAIAGLDLRCMEGPAWRAAAKITPEEADEVFYTVLVDVRDWDGGEDDVPPVVYVPESRLVAPQPHWLAAHPDPEDALDHPFAYLLFLGPDPRGDLIPSRSLREKFGVERRDVGPPPTT